MHLIVSKDHSSLFCAKPSSDSASRSLVKGEQRRGPKCLLAAALCCVQPEVIGEPGSPSAEIAIERHSPEMQVYSIEMERHSCEVHGSSIQIKVERGLDPQDAFSKI